jgi:hypothetical protein
MTAPKAMGLIVLLALLVGFAVGWKCRGEFVPSVDEPVYVKFVSDPPRLLAKPAQHLEQNRPAPMGCE